MWEFYFSSEHLFQFKALTLEISFAVSLKSDAGGIILKLLQDMKTCCRNYIKKALKDM
jgi:hypothetical protein